MIDIVRHWIALLSSWSYDDAPARQVYVTLWVLLVIGAILEAAQITVHLLR